MSRKRLLWLIIAVTLAVVVAIQVTLSTHRAAQFTAQADAPTVAVGVDIVAGIVEIPSRIRGFDYRRAAFGESWSDDTDAPGGHNGCDTRFLGGFGVLSETLREVPFTPRTFR